MTSYSACCFILPILVVHVKEEVTCKLSVMLVFLACCAVLVNMLPISGRFSE
jgi:hypothetical protein